jgi:predicted RecB family nuclease
VRDIIEYFEPDLVVLPGSRDATAYATVRDAAPDLPAVHPQLGRAGERVTHHRYAPETGVCAVDGPPSRETLDVLAVQTAEVLDRLRTELASGARATSPGAATYLVVPGLRVDWEPTNLSARLPHAEVLAAIAAALPEPVTVMAGGQPVTYSHEWSLSTGEGSTTVAVVGLGATDGPDRVADCRCTASGQVAAEAVGADRFGLGALDGVGRATARRLRAAGCVSVADVRAFGVARLTDLPGVGRQTAERMHAHAEVIETGEPLLCTNERPVRTRDDRPPLCLDIETDGLSPTILWQVGVYDPASDQYQAFVETDDPTDPEPVLRAFITWLVATHSDRTIISWNGFEFDYRYIEQFLRRHCPEYVDAWTDIWTADLYAWAVEESNALLPGRTNKLDHVARALGHEGAQTGLTGAQTAAAYQQFMRDRDCEPDWDRHRAYCEDDCRALWTVYRAIRDAPRRDATDSGTGGAAGQQAGLTDF